MDEVVIIQTGHIDARFKHEVLHSMTFARRRNRLTTHFSERIPVVKRRTSLLGVANKTTFEFCEQSTHETYRDRFKIRGPHIFQKFRSRLEILGA